MVIAGLGPAHRVELELEAVIVLPHANDESIDELDTVRSTFVSRFSAELGRRGAGVPGESIHSARLPVARVAGIDDHDAMEIATEPERGCQTRRASSDYGDIVWLIHASLRGQTWCQIPSPATSPYPAATYRAVAL
jgi:hypothetical protein